MRSSLRKSAARAAALITTALVTAALLPVGPAAAESNGGVRVMPLGDSITEGTQVPGGYRIGLWQRFGAGNYRVDFVGSQFNGPASLGDHDHQGHPGWRIDQIDANVVTWLRNTTPRTVLLHIGTNDILQNYNVAGAPARLSALIDRITATWYAALRAVPGSIGDPVAPQGRQIVGVPSGRCLDLPASSTANGTQLQLWDCHGQPNQSWTHNSSRQLVVLGTKCLDAYGRGTTNGTQVVTWDCHGDTNQQWNVNANGTITSAQSGLCLDAHNLGTANGTKLVLWACTGQPNQQWAVRTP